MDGFIFTNGSIDISKSATDISQSAGNVMSMIGFAMAAAIALGIIYAIYLILTNGGE